MGVQEPKELSGPTVQALAPSSRDCDELQLERLGKKPVLKVIGKRSWNASQTSIKWSNCYCLLTANLWRFRSPWIELYCSWNVGGPTWVGENKNQKLWFVISKRWSGSPQNIHYTIIEVRLWCHEAVFIIKSSQWRLGGGCLCLHICLDRHCMLFCRPLRAGLDMSVKLNKQTLLFINICMYSGRQLLEANTTGVPCLLQSNTWSLWAM